MPLNGVPRVFFTVILRTVFYFGVGMFLELGALRTLDGFCLGGHTLARLLGSAGAVHGRAIDVFGRLLDMDFLLITMVVSEVTCWGGNERGEGVKQWQCVVCGSLDEARVVGRE